MGSYIASALTGLAGAAVLLVGVAGVGPWAGWLLILLGFSVLGLQVPVNWNRPEYEPEPSAARPPDEPEPAPEPQGGTSEPPAPRDAQTAAQSPSRLPTFDQARRVITFALGVVVTLAGLTTGPSFGELGVGLVLIGVLPIENLLEQRK